MHTRYVFHVYFILLPVMSFPYVSSYAMLVSRSVLAAFLCIAIVIHSYHILILVTF